MRRASLRRRVIIAELTLDVKAKEKQPEGARRQNGDQVEGSRSWTSETYDAVGIDDAMSKILGQNVAEDAQTILAKRTTAHMGEIQSDKKEIKTA
ncbi:hypothetical protein PR003_g30549 [Phytophthora rubi]|uniref:Uncharacterized protein n=1 Tax=Phytophthora rubi TaxID=129364 RepID=A0A6A4BDE0_9STRA|nr:hypothetical protein PR003_g30549 [Phytophthora rubi]